VVTESAEVICSCAQDAAILQMADASQSSVAAVQLQAVVPLQLVVLT
jgi:hypothetical protein